MTFDKQLNVYFEGRENKLPQVSYKPMLKYFWDASAYFQQAKIDKLTKALEFYADHTNYGDEGNRNLLLHDNSVYEGIYSNYYCGGKLARQALKEIND